MSEYHELSIIDVAPQTRNAVTLTFGVPEHLRETFRFIPGQHLKLKTRINDSDVERFYSICAGVDGNVQVGIKKVTDGVFSQHACSNIKIGDTLSVMAPQGDFCLPQGQELTDAKTFCFVAAGSGITPVLAMVDYLLCQTTHTKVVLIYINPSQRDIMFFDQLEQLKDRYMTRLSLVHILTREGRELPLLSQRPDQQSMTQILNMFVGGDIDHAYLCGPLALIETCREALLARGTDKKAIHMELFGTPSPQQSSKPIVHSDDDTIATIITNGRAQKVPIAEGQSILDAALESGADVPFACKGGVCATCKAKVTEGKASMTINYGLEDDEVAAGYILTCQAHIEGETATFDFDV